MLVLARLVIGDEGPVRRIECTVLVHVCAVGWSLVTSVPLSWPLSQNVRSCWHILLVRNLQAPVAEGHSLNHYYHYYYYYCCCGLYLLNSKLHPSVDVPSHFDLQRSPAINSVPSVGDLRSDQTRPDQARPGQARFARSKCAFRHHRICDEIPMMDHVDSIEEIPTRLCVSLADLVLISRNDKIDSRF